MRDNAHILAVSAAAVLVFALSKARTILRWLWGKLKAWRDGRRTPSPTPPATPTPDAQPQVTPHVILPQRERGDVGPAWGFVDDPTFGPSPNGKGQ